MVSTAVRKADGTWDILVGFLNKDLQELTARPDDMVFIDIGPEGHLKVQEEMRVTSLRFFSAETDEELQKRVYRFLGIEIHDTRAHR